MRTTQQLATFIVNHDAGDIPCDVRDQAVRCVVNWAACAVGGSRHPAVDCALAAIQPFMGPAQATLLGRHERADIMHASLLNGISSHVLDFDDTHLATLVHPSGPVLSALFAFAQYHPMDGKSFIDALIFGIEVECRVALGVYPAHYDIGWHITGTVGGFGAAAALGRAMALTPEQMTWALSIAATQASGLREMFGTMCKSLHPGRAAQSGLSAAFLAAAGFDSSSAGIEALRGFAHVLSPECDLPRITDQIGGRWEILANSFKPYACGVVIHPIIDCCIALCEREAFDPNEIEEILLHVNPLVQELTGKPEPQTGLEGKFSVHHSAAAVLIEGRSRAEHYTDLAVRDPASCALRRRVVLQPDPHMREDAATVGLRMRDGGFFEHHVNHALGSKERPMGAVELSAKFRDLAGTILPAEQVREALAACWDIESMSDVSRLAELLAATAN